MTIIKVNLHDGGLGRSNLAGHNNIGSPSTTGTRVANLLDVNGDPTGVSFVQSVSMTATGAGTQALSAPSADFPVEFYQSHWYPGFNATVELGKLTGLPTGASYTIKIAGNHGGSTVTNYTASNGAPSPASYDNAGQTDPVPAPVVITGTVPENGEMSITFGANGYARANGFSIEYTAATGPSITAADDITAEGQTATLTLSGNTAAPTSATLNGTDVGTLTDQGSGVYSYAAPLIADDATADLVVSVDSTTATTTIAYANSYDRDQLTHPATEAEYSKNSLSYPNAYATTQPYEWKVIADANASVITINWNALEADDGFHKDVASYATPVANGSTTVTLGVFVPETGQAYQFDRTITVSDGGVVVSDSGRHSFSLGFSMGF